MNLSLPIGVGKYDPIQVAPSHFDGGYVWHFGLAFERCGFLNGTAILPNHHRGGAMDILAVFCLSALVRATVPASRAEGQGGAASIARTRAWHGSDWPETMDALTEQVERIKASIRAEVERPFRVIKRRFSHVNVRYRGLAKNTAQLHTLFALANLCMVRKRLTGGAGMSAPGEWEMGAKCAQNA